MKKVLVSSLSTDELKKMLKDSLLSSFKLRVQKSIQQLGNFNQLKSIRRDVARYKTELCSRGESV